MSEPGNLAGFVAPGTQFAFDFANRSRSKHNTHTTSISGNFVNYDGKTNMGDDFYEKTIWTPVAWTWNKYSHRYRFNIDVNGDNGLINAFNTEVGKDFRMGITKLDPKGYFLYRSLIYGLTGYDMGNWNKNWGNSFIPNLPRDLNWLSNNTNDTGALSDKFKNSVEYRWYLSRILSKMPGWTHFASGGFTPAGPPGGGPGGGGGGSGSDPYSQLIQGGLVANFGESVDAQGAYTQ